MISCVIGYKIVSAMVKWQWFTNFSIYLLHTSYDTVKTFFSGQNIYMEDNTQGADHSHCLTLVSQQPLWMTFGSSPVLLNSQIGQFLGSCPHVFTSKVAFQRLRESGVGVSFIAVKMGGNWSSVGEGLRWMCSWKPLKWKGGQGDGNDQIGVNLTFNLRGPSYLGITRSISWLLMPWLLTSPGLDLISFDLIWFDLIWHQQPWWLCRIGRF